MGAETCCSLLTVCSLFINIRYIRLGTVIMFAFVISQVVSFYSPTEQFKYLLSLLE